MKTKVTQEKWNDARDAFLCAIIQGAIIKEGQYRLSKATEAANYLTSELYEVKEVQTVDLGVHKAERTIRGEWVEPQDTRPFNPKVVEIFNQYLPKEIAPLAIEAHKRSCEIDEFWLHYGHDLPSSLGHCIRWGKNEDLGDFESLYGRVIENTITATPKQLREWFPSAYQNEGGENE
jgi:hypothetical protein